MQPISKHTGLVMPLDRVNVDTDQMVPKQFLKALTRQGFGRNLFYDWRYLPGEAPNPEFVLNLPRYRGASVLLARANFGCGSSREHAPWALLDYGFRVLIAPSFADIFYNNCFKNGILPITLPDAQVDELFRRAEASVGYKLTADLSNQTVSEEEGLSSEISLRAEDLRIDTFCGQESGIENAVRITHLPTGTVVQCQQESSQQANRGLAMEMLRREIEKRQRLSFHFDIDDFRKTVLLEGLDDIGLTLKHEPEITAYEQRNRPQVAVYDSVDFKQ